jgi:hypothetical protein
MSTEHSQLRFQLWERGHLSPQCTNRDAAGRKGRGRRILCIGLRNKHRPGDWVLSGDCGSSCRSTTRPSQPDGVSVKMTATCIRQEK